MTTQLYALLGGGDQAEGARVHEKMMRDWRKGLEAWSEQDLADLERAAAGGYALPQWAVEYLLYCDREREARGGLPTGRCPGCGYLTLVDFDYAPPLPIDHICAPLPDL